MCDKAIWLSVSVVIWGILQVRLERIFSSFYWRHLGTRIFACTLHEILNVWKKEKELLLL